MNAIRRTVLMLTVTLASCVAAPSGPAAAPAPGPAMKPNVPEEVAKEIAEKCAKVPKKDRARAFCTKYYTGEAQIKILLAQANAPATQSAAQTSPQAPLPPPRPPTPAPHPQERIAAARSFIYANGDPLMPAYRFVQVPFQLGRGYPQAVVCWERSGIPVSVVDNSGEITKLVKVNLGGGGELTMSCSLPFVQPSDPTGTPGEVMRLYYFVPTYPVPDWSTRRDLTHVPFRLVKDCGYKYRKSPRTTIDVRSRCG